MIFHRPCRDFPAVLSAGDSWAWTLPLNSVAPAGATLVYTFRQGETLVNVSGARADDSMSFSFVATTTDTAKLSPGLCPYFARLAADGHATTIRNGLLRVLPNLADPNAETRTAAEIDLAEAENALAAIRANPNSSYTTSSGTFTKQNLAVLRTEVDRLRIIVQRERGQSGGVTIRTAFGSRCGSLNVGTW